MRAVRAVEVRIDVVDPGPVAEFWTRLLGYVVEGDADARWVHLKPPVGLPVINLQRVPEAKVGKNRLHLDVFVDDPLEWIRERRSARRPAGSHARRRRDWFCVMIDPAGNEFCICREGEVETVG